MIDPDRGRHKIFLGMAAGVGKTYRMLQEGHAEAEAGRDVVIGYLETARPRRHRGAGRRARGRPAPARRPTATRRSRSWTSRGVLRRTPELCLIDELAHTNAPGVEHAKRYEDVARRPRRRHRRVLDGQRPAPRVAQRPHRRADRRAGARDGPRPRPRPGRRGRPHRPHARGAARPAARRQGLPRASASTPRSNNFFKIENLAALREVALRQVAEDVEAKRLVTERVGTREERVSAERGAAGGRRAAARARRALPRRAAPRAARLAVGPAPRRASSTCCGSSRRAAIDAEQERQLDALRQLAVGARRAAARRGVRRRRRRPSPRSFARARHAPTSSWARPARRAASPACASRFPSGSWPRSPASTSASSQTGPRAPWRES